MVSYGFKSPWRFSHHEVSNAKHAPQLAPDTQWLCCIPPQQPVQPSVNFPVLQPQISNNQQVHCKEIAHVDHVLHKLYNKALCQHLLQLMLLVFLFLFWTSFISRSQPPPKRHEMQLLHQPSKHHQTCRWKTWSPYCDSLGLL